MLYDPALPCFPRKMHNLDPAHAFRFTRSDDGIHMQWKQWCTDENWSRPIQLLAPHEVQLMAAWRPGRPPMEFPENGRANLNWVNQFETWCASQPEQTLYQGLERELAWLRSAFQHQLPGAYAPGNGVEPLIADLRGLPHGRPGAHAPGAHPARLPDDVVAQLFPSGDVPHIPAESLVRVETITQRAGADRRDLRSDFIAPGSTILVAAPAGGAEAHGHNLPIVVGIAVETSVRRGTILVAWYVPELASAENYRGGKKRMVLDVFGPWRPIDRMNLAELRKHRLPEPLVRPESILEANFSFDGEGGLPYDLFDSLRTKPLLT